MQLALWNHCKLSDLTGNGINKFLTAGFLFVLIFVFGVTTGLSDQLQVGMKAPNLLGNDAISGNRINLFMMHSELRFKRDDNGYLVLGNDGKYINEFVRNVVVLNFFSRVCIPCIREIPSFNRIAYQYQLKPVKFLYINVDPELSQEQAKDFIENYSIQVPMMLCNQAEAIRKYGADTLPRLIIIDQQKAVAHIITGFDENLESELSRIIDNLLLPEDNEIEDE